MSTLIQYSLCAWLPRALAVLSRVCWEQRCLIAESLRFAARFCYFFTLTVCLKRCDSATDGTGIACLCVGFGRTALSPAFSTFPCLSPPFQALGEKGLEHKQL